jgi:hypothetical protein
LREGDALFPLTGRPNSAYFPTSSVIALLYDVDKRRAMAKAWPVGREGMLGISLFLGVEQLDHRAEVQIGGTAFRLSGAALLTEFRQVGALQNLLLRYVFALITQASQLGVCGSHHPIEQRLCRFLLCLFDRVSGDEVSVTHVRIAELLSVRRTSITLAAMRLQADGLIEYVRGHVRLLDRKKLEERSCVCAAIIRRAFKAVLE